MLKIDSCLSAVLLLVTHVLKAHPGGPGQLLAQAGKDTIEILVRKPRWNTSKKIVGLMGALLSVWLVFLLGDVRLLLASVLSWRCVFCVFHIEVRSAHFAK